MCIPRARRTHARSHAPAAPTTPRPEVEGASVSCSTAAQHTCSRCGSGACLLESRGCEGGTYRVRGRGGKKRLAPRPTAARGRRRRQPRLQAPSLLLQASPRAASGPKTSRYLLKSVASNGARLQAPVRPQHAGEPARWTCVLGEVPRRPGVLNPAYRCFSIILLAQRSCIGRGWAGPGVGRPLQPLHAVLNASTNANASSMLLYPSATLT
jgi:hypothetical protein